MKHNTTHCNTLQQNETHCNSRLLCFLHCRGSFAKKSGVCGSLLIAALVCHVTIQRLDVRDFCVVNQLHGKPASWQISCCNALQHTATHCNATRSTTLQHPISFPQCNKMLCNTLQHTATHCNTHCSIMQHTALHCNTQYPLPKALLQYATYCTATPSTLSPRR